MTEENSIELTPPPRIEAHGQLHPPDEFRFADQASPPADAEYEAYEPVESTPIEDRPVLTDEDAEEAVRAVQDNDQVTEMLEDHRHEIIGAGLDLYAGGKEEEPTPQYTVVIYDYMENHVLEVTLDADCDVEDVSTATYQPSGTPDELERAVEMARSHEWLSEHLGREMIGTAMIVIDPDSSDRKADVRFRQPDRRLPSYWATVNLSTESVESVGSVGSSGHGNLDPSLAEILRSIGGSGLGHLDSTTIDTAGSDDHG